MSRARGPATTDGVFSPRTKRQRVLVHFMMLSDGYYLLGVGDPLRRENTKFIGNDMERALGVLRGCILAGEDIDGNVVEALKP